MLHIMAGILLIIQTALIMLLEKTVSHILIDVLAMVVWLLAILFIFYSMHELRRSGNVDAGKNYTETTALANKGLYGLIRHPQYFGWALMYVAVFLFNPRWLIALLGIAGIVCVYLFTLQGERTLVIKFGDAYTEYMEVVPRYNILLGIARWLKKRSK